MTSQMPAARAAFDAHRVCAVIVTYGPDPELLRRVVDSVLQQVGHLVVFDNGSFGLPCGERMMFDRPEVANIFG